MSNVEERTLQRRVKHTFMKGLQPRWMVFSASPRKTTTTAKAVSNLDFAYAALEGPLFHGRADGDSGRTQL